MNIAVLGSGNVGSALAEAFVAAGHTVTVTADDPENATALAEKVGAKSASTNTEAVQGADVVALALPWGAVSDVVDEVGGSLDGKVVIDATNPLKEDYSGLATSGRSGAEEVQRSAPGARVVKAFNTVFSSRQPHPDVGGTKLDGFYAGDDEDAKSKVAGLLGSIGYHPIDAGALRMARSLEEMAFLNISLNARNGWPWQSGWKLVGPTS